jgi:hypothetical protein
MKRPVRVHDVQKLTGCLAALSRFISRLGEKALPLYRLMKKSDKFEWTPEANAAFAELKDLLSTQPVLAAPISLYCFTLQPLDRLSAQCSRSIGKNKAKPTKFSAQCTIFLKS